MAAPWEKDEVVGGGAAPWANDEIVSSLQMAPSHGPPRRYTKRETFAGHSANAVLGGLLPVFSGATRSQGMETVPGSGTFAAEPGIDVPAREAPMEGTSRIEVARALKESARQNPWTAAGANVVGGLGSPMAAVTPAGTASRVGAGLAAGGLYGFGGSTAESMAERLRDVPGPAAVGGVAGFAAPYVAQGVSRAAGWAGDKLGGIAETAARRSLNADRTATRRVLQNSPEKASELGRFLLDEGVPLRSPQAAREGAQAVMDAQGPAIGAVTDQAGKLGARVNIGDAALEAIQNPAIANLAKNSETRGAHQRVIKFFEDQIEQNGEAVTPAAAHDLRQQLDRLAKWDSVRAPELVDAWRAARGAISDSLTASMEGSGLGPAWQAANATYKNAARAEELARIGAERRVGNRLLSPSEVGASVVGGALGIGTHNPVAAALPIGVMAANRLGPPVAAHAANVAGQGLGGFSRVAAQPGAGQAMTPAAVDALISYLNGGDEPSQAAALARAMRRRD